jgi:hypothetical protein
VIEYGQIIIGVADLLAQKLILDDVLGFFLFIFFCLRVYIYIYIYMIRSLSDYIKHTILQIN